MLSYIEKNDKTLCCGCRACEQACPKSCIDMKYDDEGFMYPILDKKLCTNCGICSAVCPIGKENLFHTDKQEVYAAYHKNTKTLQNSSSGGAFTAIVNAFCNENYVVFGAAYDQDFTVSHSPAQSKDEFVKFRKTKYVQSDIGNSYNQTRQFLESGKKVMFTGTPCQIAGLKSFLGKDYDNLLCVDIICYGVPSPGVFKDYVDFMQKKYQSKIISMDFRDKFIGTWKKHYMHITFKNGKGYIQKFADDPFVALYFSKVIHRPICHSCPFTKPQRVSDVTIADFWGIEKHNPEMLQHIRDGISLIIINTPKGNDVFNKTTSELNVVAETLEHAISGNPRLISSTPPSPKKQQFLKDMRLLPINKLANKYNAMKKNIFSEIAIYAMRRVNLLLKVNR